MGVWQSINCNAVCAASCPCCVFSALFKRIVITTCTLLVFPCRSSQELAHAASCVTNGVHAGLLAQDDVSWPLLQRCLHTSDCPPVELLLRTSGESRLSDFMLWQGAWAHLRFLDKLWPDVTYPDVARAILSYQRAAGGLVEAQAAARAAAAEQQGELLGAAAAAPHTCSQPAVLPFEGCSDCCPGACLGSPSCSSACQHDADSCPVTACISDSNPTPGIAFSGGGTCGHGWLAPACEASCSFDALEPPSFLGPSGVGLGARGTARDLEYMSGAAGKARVQEYLAVLEIQKQGAIAKMAMLGGTSMGKVS